MYQQVGWQAGQLIASEVKHPQALQAVKSIVVHEGEPVVRQPEVGQLGLCLEGPVLDPGEAVPGEVHEGELGVELEGGGAHLLQAVLLQGQALDGGMKC